MKLHKQNLKRGLSLLLALLLVLSAVALSACGAKEEAGLAATEPLKIGIIQIVEHPSLNTIREAFIAQLAASGYTEGDKITIDYQNAQGDPTNLKTISQKFASGGYDLIVAIATPSAQAAIGETKEIPVIFAACTDPVGSGIVASLEQPGGNVTGTSDAVSAEKIMTLAKELTPGIKTIGALYNAGETNSVSVINDLKAYAAANGMTVVEGTVTTSSEVQQATAALAGKVDAIFSPIDNTVASAMPVVAKVANDAKIPVYVGADSMVKDGGLATYGINYQILGQETANMAVKVFEGTKAGDIPVMTMDKMDIYVNQDTADQIGVTIPDTIASQATIFKAK